MRDLIVRIRALWRKRNAPPVQSCPVRECFRDYPRVHTATGIISRRPPYPAQSTREVTGRVVRS